jgi:hypothetical protein
LAIFAGIDFFRINPIITNTKDAIAAVMNIRLNASLEGNNEHFCCCSQ